MNDPITRRKSLLTLGGALGAALAGGAWRLTTADGEESSGPAAVANGAVKCVLAPELTEGPYYVAGEKVRRNITEGRPGTPLSLHLSVLNASTCRPIKGAAVDIWHCDALGNYSGVNGASTTFMRGIQRTNAKGLAIFRSVFPGWYTGRAVHIHVKVHVGGSVVHTGQLFFNDSLTDRVYRKSPYNTRGSRDTRNAADSIFRNGGKKGLLSVRGHGSGYVASIAMGVHTS
ncbi:MAG TPA: intradiol ring-cleavage dioxygenase [Thermoleophilaceae bacterium]|jgi:protocatechuate 3,4-dioxygenase beta subunit